MPCRFVESEGFQKFCETCSNYAARFTKSNVGWKLKKSNVDKRWTIKVVSRIERRRQRVFWRIGSRHEKFDLASVHLHLYLFRSTVETFGQPNVSLRLFIDKMQFICESNSFQRWSNVVVNCANRAITIVVNEYEFSRIIFGRFAIVFTYFSLARLRQFDVRTFASQEYRYRYATAFKSRTDVSKEDVPEAEGNNLVRNNLVIFTDQFLDQLHQSHAHFRFSNRANTRVEIMTQLCA